MAWFKVDDGFWAHPKTFMLSNDAIALWVKGGTWASQMLTDGRVPVGSVAVFRAPESAALELVESGLWALDGEHYVFHDWDEYQPSASIEKSKRAARAESARKAACARWHGPECAGQCESHAVAHAPGHATRDSPGDAEPHAESMPRPVPSRPEDSKESSTRAKETSLPSDWVPTKTHYELAKERNVDIMTEAESFRDHAYTHDRRAARWNGAFTSWLKKAKPQQRVAAPDAWMNRSQAEVPRWKQG